MGSIEDPRDDPSVGPGKTEVLSGMRGRYDPRSIEMIFSHVLRELGRPAAALSVSFVSRRTIRDLNARYRGRPYATDVLSFPYPGETVDGVPLLGEIVIAPEVAERNARAAGVRAAAEMRKLLVHGTLHLLGYDHETDHGRMRRLERRLLALRSIPGLRRRRAGK